MGSLSPARAPQFMGDAVSTDSETERKLYAQIAGWIENKKILTDMTFVVCYGRAFYDLAMEFAYERDAEYGEPGWRAHRTPIFLLCSIRRLQDLTGGGWANDPRFQPFIEMLKRCSSAEQDQACAQVTTASSIWHK